jgi:hypothetical protein
MARDPISVSLEVRLGHLERQLRVMRITRTIGMLVLLIAAYGAVRVWPTRAADSGQVLRVRGLIIEDAQGRPRILLGAPVPKAAGRKRQDDASGIVLLGENGADRVAIGDPTPNPQTNGKILKRISPGSGLIVDDTGGNERAGIGVSGNGRSAVCLDYPAPSAREAVCLGVVPESLAGILINAPTGDNGERAMMAVLKDGTSLLKLADTNGNERTMLLIQGDSPAQFLVLDPRTKTKVDVLTKIRP